MCSLQPRSCPELSPAQTLCERNAGPQSWDCMCLTFVVCKVSLFSFILFTLLFLLLMVKKCPSGKNMFLKNTLRFNLYFFFCYQKVSTNKSFPQATTNCLIKHIHPVKHGPILSCWFTLSCVLFCRVPLIRYGLLVE